MINQEFKALRRKYQVLPNFGICCRELRGSELGVFAHASTVSALLIMPLFAFMAQLCIAPNMLEKSNDILSRD